MRKFAGGRGKKKELLGRASTWCTKKLLKLSLQRKAEET